MSFFLDDEKLSLVPVFVLLYCCIVVLPPFHLFQPFFLHNCQSCLGHINFMSRSCQGHVRVMSGSSQGHVRVMSGSCQSQCRVICKGHVKIISKAVRVMHGPF